MEAYQPDSDRNEAGIFLSAGFRRYLELAQFPELFIKDRKLLRRCLGVDGLWPAGLPVVIDGEDFALGGLNSFGDGEDGFRFLLQSRFFLVFLGRCSGRELVPLHFQCGGRCRGRCSTTWRRHWLR